MKQTIADFDQHASEASARHPINALPILLITTAIWAVIIAAIRFL